MRKKVITIILSLIYTIFMTVGTSFIKSNSFKCLKDNLIIMIIFRQFDTKDIGTLIFLLIHIETKTKSKDEKK